MAVETNILDNYRSVSYNFTFAAITPAQLADPKQEWRSRPLDFIIASTKGKRENQFNASAAGDKSALVTSFNKNSPGAFDLWVDNVEIDTIMAPTEQTGPALGTKVTFEVYEPYSVNGLIEALHVSAQAAGWSGYINATFIIKVEFMGYKDTGSDDVPEIIKADKIIPIRLTGADIEVTEQGTRYKCKGIPVNEMAMSNPNKLTAPRQMTGGTVGDVLKDLIKGVNDGIQDRAKKEKTNSKIYDSYEIFFPDYPKDGTALEEKDTNKIKDAKINEILTSNNVYQFQDLADKEKNPNGSDPDKKYDPKNSIVQFPANADVIDIITAVIRDSKYLKDILEKIKKEANDDDGMIDYFQVITKSIPKEFDSTNNKQCYKYQYLVVPYKVHSSQLPDQHFNKFDAKQMDKLLKRSYDYFYGGKNVDIINFKLNFNNLYFQASNANQGNTPTSETASSAAPPNNLIVTKPDNQAANANKTVNEASSVQVINEASGNINRAGPPSDDPYWQIAFNAHQSILESVSLLTGEIELLGDPYYLCTSGMGNYTPPTKDIAQTSTGEANFTSSPVVVRFNFRNPIDIGENGFLNFSKPAPFSGLYRVIKCQSVFRDGLFKQNLKVIRYQGQISEDESTKATLAPPLQTKEDPADSFTADSAPASALSAGSRLNGLNLAKLAGKGVPSLGLPGSLNQMIASGSYFPGVSDFLNNEIKGGGASEVAKAASGLLGNALGVLNGGGISGLVGKATAALGSNPLASLSNLANGAVSGIGSLVSNPSSLLSQANGVIGQGVNLINQSSGIGLQVGKTLEGLNPLTAGIRADASSIGNAVNQIKGIGSNVLDNANSMIANVTSVNGLNLSLDQRSSVVTDALSKGISPDLALRSASTLGIKLPNVSQLTPGAMLGQLGIDPSQLSGLNIDSKGILNQIKSISDSVPENVDINDAKKLGISLANLDQITLKNLPAFPSLNVRAPDVEKSLTDALDDSPGDPKILAKFGLTQALGDLKSNIPGALSNLSNLKGGLGIALPSANSLMASAQAGFGSSITSQLGSLTGGSPLDKLNIPKIGLG
jgi:hypothetical protein